MTGTLRERTVSLIAVALMGLGMAFGQANTGTITGIVTDPTGAAIPGAHLESTSELTGLTRAVTSNSAGHYAFSFLPIGRYSITATARGFRTETRKELAITAGQVLTLDLHLRVGQMTQTVTVSGTPSILNYSNPEQRATLSSEKVHQLPLAKQDWSSLLTTTVNGLHYAGDSITMNGLPPGAINLTVDGTNAEADPEVPTIGFYGGFNTINAVNTAAIAEINVTKGVAPASAIPGGERRHYLKKRKKRLFHCRNFEG